MSSSILDVYNRYDFIPLKAKGVYLYDKNGRKVLDFLAGIAVNVLGYKNKVLEKAIKEQLKKGLYHQSNYYYNDETEEFANKLCEISGIKSGKVFFQNSGAEADECAVKIARKWFNSVHNSKYCEIICMSNAFHGRTTTTISATLRHDLVDGFEPLTPGFKIAEFNNIESIKEQINEHTCAVMLETIQGEGGVLPCEKQFLKDLRKLCNEKNILLILDEIQCGNGRTGKYFAYQHYGVLPDILTIAKGLSGGLPIGACIVKDEIGKYMQKGSHGSTFGGNAFCCHVGNACVEELTKESFLKNVNKIGEYFQSELKKICNKYPKILLGWSGIGLMLGLSISKNHKAKDIAKNLLKNGLSCGTAGKNQIRFLPPLIITKKHINEAIKIIEKTIVELV